MRSRMIAAITAAAFASVWLGAPATAKANQLPMPVTGSTPASGASVTEGASISFSVATTVGCRTGIMGLTLVAANGATVYSSTLSGGAGSPYVNYPFPDWKAVPGAYTWSVKCTAYSNGGLSTDDYTSSAFPLTVAAAPIKSLTPANGASFPQGTNLFGQFQLRTDRADLNCASSLLNRVEVSTQPALGQDGTLASDFEVGEMLVQRSDAFPDLYRDVMNVFGGYTWENRPGTYYWQMIVCNYNTPVQSFAIAAPAATSPPPSIRTLRVGEARHAATRSLRRRATWRHGKRHRLTCSRASSLRVRCRGSWNYKRARYRTTVTVIATSNTRMSVRVTVWRVT